MDIIQELKADLEANDQLLKEVLEKVVNMKGDAESLDSFAILVSALRGKIEFAKARAIAQKYRNTPVTHLFTQAENYLNYAQYSSPPPSAVAEVEEKQEYNVKQRMNSEDLEGLLELAKKENIPGQLVQVFMEELEEMLSDLVKFGEEERYSIIYRHLTSKIGRDNAMKLASALAPFDFKQIKKVMKQRAEQQEERKEQTKSLLDEKLEELKKQGLTSTDLDIVQELLPKIASRVSGIGNREEKEATIYSLCVSTLGREKATQIASTFSEFPFQILLKPTQELAAPETKKQGETPEYKQEWERKLQNLQEKGVSSESIDVFVKQLEEVKKAVFASPTDVYGALYQYLVNKVGRNDAMKIAKEFEKFDWLALIKSEQKGEEVSKEVEAVFTARSIEKELNERLARVRKSGVSEGHINIFRHSLGTIKTVLEEQQSQDVYGAVYQVLVNQIGRNAAIEFAKAFEDFDFNKVQAERKEWREEREPQVKEKRIKKKTVEDVIKQLRSEGIGAYAISVLKMRLKAIQDKLLEADEFQDNYSVIYSDLQSTGQLQRREAMKIAKALAEVDLVSNLKAERERKEEELREKKTTEEVLIEEQGREEVKKLEEEIKEEKQLEEAEEEKELGEEEGVKEEEKEKEGKEEETITLLEEEEEIKVPPYLEDTRLVLELEKLPVGKEKYDKIARAVTNIVEKLMASEDEEVRYTIIYRALANEIGRHDAMKVATSLKGLDPRLLIVPYYSQSVKMLEEVQAQKEKATEEEIRLLEFEEESKEEEEVKEQEEKEEEDDEGLDILDLMGMIKRTLPIEYKGMSESTIYDIVASVFNKADLDDEYTAIYRVLGDKYDMDTAQHLSSLLSDLPYQKLRRLRPKEEVVHVVEETEKEKRETKVGESEKVEQEASRETEDKEGTLPTSVEEGLIRISSQYPEVEETVKAKLDDIRQRVLNKAPFEATKAIIYSLLIESIEPNKAMEIATILENVNWEESGQEQKEE